MTDEPIEKHQPIIPKEMTPEEKKEFEKHLRQMKRIHHGCFGLIVGRLNEEDKVVAFWDGQFCWRVEDDTSQYPKLFVSVNAAQQRADDLNKMKGMFVPPYMNSPFDDVGQPKEGDRPWELIMWVHPDYYLEGWSRPTRYTGMTGIQFPGSPRQ